MATVAGGQFSTANGTLATVSGGEGNTASGSHSAIAGGWQNTASGLESTVAGGALNAASGGSSLAAGHRAQATATGSFAWADAQEFDFQVSAANFFGIRATGGVGLTVGINPTTGAVTEFCNLLPAATPSWACTSDRDVKEHFVPADGKDILQRLVAMPLFSWSMKNGDPAIRSLGPTAQDFFEAFALGKNDKTIAILNLEGVAIAAIKGLHQIVQEKEARIATLEQQVSELQSLRGELAALKATVAEMAIARERVANR